MSEFLARQSRARAARDDLIEGAARWQLWLLLGWQDIVQRYRRSIIGPWWLTISMGVLVGALGVLYAGLFGVPVHDYLPFLALGFVSWGLISGVMIDGCNVFIEAENVIKQVRMPFTMHVLKLIWRHFIVFGHNLVIFVIVALIFPVPIGWSALLALPGLVLLFANAFWVALLLGLICVRFRDVPQIVASIVQVAFFLTPIIWKPELLKGRAFVLEANPFYHFTELVRGPLLGTPPGALSWIVAIGMLVVGSALTFALFARFRWRIAYWV